MKKLTALILLLLLLAGCTAANQPTAAEAPQIFSVHFIDVGQGDSILLEYDSQYALIDGGYAETGPALVQYLHDQGVDELDLVIGTHNHGDHVGGLGLVLDVFEAGRVWCGSTSGYTSAYRDFISAAEEQGLMVEKPRPGEVFFLGDVKLQVLGPLGSYYEDVNNTSIVVMATYGDHRFLLTGDMRWEAEQELVEAGLDLKADVLKAGHHGSYTSTSALLLGAVKPTYAVISCGRSNDYGHPHDEPMARLRGMGVTIFRTDLMGTIVFSTDGTTLSYSWEFTTAEPEVNVLK